MALCGLNAALLNMLVEAVRTGDELFCKQAAYRQRMAGVNNPPSLAHSDHQEGSH